MHYHRNAKTNIKQREAIKKSSLSGRGLAKKYEMAERMVRTIKDHTVHFKRYPDVSSLISDNENFQEVHNFRRRLKVLNYKTPYEVTLEWFIKEPDIFLKNPNVLLNENIPKL